MSEESLEDAHCRVCEADLDSCEVCGELPCGQAIRLRCLSLALGLRLPEPHTHGGSRRGRRRRPLVGTRRGLMAHLALAA